MYPLFSFATIASVAAIHILLAVVLLYSTWALSAADDTASCRELYSAIARDDNVEIVEALIKVAPVECSLYKAIDSKWTVLSWAAYKGHTTIVDSLLKFGADPNIKNNVSIYLYLNVYLYTNVYIYIYICMCILYMPTVLLMCMKY